MNVANIDRASRYQTALKESPDRWKLYIPLAKLYPTPIEQSHVLLKGAWHALDKKEYEIAQKLSDEAQKRYGNTFSGRVIEIELLRAEKQEDRIPGKLLEIGLIFKERGLCDQAVKAYKRLAHLDQNPTTYQEVIDLYVNIGKEQKAIRWKEKLVRLHEYKLKTLGLTLTNPTPIQTPEPKRHVEITNELPETNANQNQANLEGLTRLQRGRVRAKLQRDKTDKNRIDSKDCTQLFIAAQNGHTEVVNALLQKDDKDESDSKEKDPLFKGTLDRRIADINPLLKADIDKGQASINEFTPLYLAAEQGHVEIVNSLLKDGANKDQVSFGGFTPLCVAAKNGHVKVVQELLKAGANKNQATPRGRHTPLWIAAHMGHIEVVNALLEDGANKNQAGSDYTTPLWIAAEKGHVEVVNVLLKNGVHKDRADSRGFTPLYVAAKNGHIEIVSVLLKAGANKDRASKKGITPLRIAELNEHAAIVKALKDSGAKRTSLWQLLRSQKYFS